MTRVPIVVPFEAVESDDNRNTVYTCFLHDGLTVGFRVSREVIEDGRENEFVEPLQLSIIRMAEMG